MMSDTQHALQLLTGLPLRTIGRSADLLWMNFGEWRETPDHRGGTRIVGEWALHIQCDWRFSKSGYPTLSPADYHVGPQGREIGEGWDIIGANRFDAIAQALRAAFETAPPRVTAVGVEPAGRFAMDFDDGSRLVVHPGEDGDDEAWRLFEPGTDRAHIVMPPDG